MKKKIFKWAKIIIIVYCLVGIAVYYLQDNSRCEAIPGKRYIDAVEK